jgi:NADH:ubiquinone oxidoreductase subunit C
MLYLNFLFYIIQLLPKLLLLVSLQKLEISLLCVYDNIFVLFFILKKHTQVLLNTLVDLTLIDLPQKKLRFKIIYIARTLKYNTTIKIKASLLELVAIPSLSFLFLSASWFEREAWDMFGIFFINHTRLKRLLTDYGFTGYPLRKDFPFCGFYEVRFSELLQRLSYEPVTLSSAPKLNEI